MEYSHDMQKEKLEFSDILKEALRVPLKNIKFIILTLLASIPLLYFMSIYEITFQRTLIQASEIIDPRPYLHQPYYIWAVGWTPREFYLQLVQLCLVYLVPLYVSELITMAVIVSLGSKIYSGKRMTLKEMVIGPIKGTRWDGILLTSFYVLALSTCTLVGLTWLLTSYFFISKISFYGWFFFVFYAPAFVVLLKKYLEWSAVWNMGIVASILEGVHGTEALMLAAYFGRGSEQRGLLLMLIFFVWGYGLRLSCLCVACHERGNGVIVQAGLFCVGNLIKWVVCMIYYFDCKTRILEKKIDEEVGIKSGRQILHGEADEQTR